MTAVLEVRKGQYSLAGRQVVEISSGQSLSEYLSSVVPGYKPGPDQPLQVRLNGVELDPKHWETTELQPGDRLLAYPRPFGWELVIGFVIAAVVSVAMKPSVPRTPDYYQQQESSPTYDANAQSNRSRINNPITSAYGITRTFPNLASQGYRRYIGNDQFLYHVFGLGHGDHLLTDKRAGNTPVENFDGFEDAVYKAGEKVTLFEPDVITSGDVSGISLPAPNDDEYDPGVNDGRTQAYVLGDPGDVIKRVEFDLVTPRGFHKLDDEGRSQKVTATIQCRYQELDEQDNPVGDWFYVSPYTIKGSSSDVLRRTVGFDLPVDRCRVDFVRTSESDGPEDNQVVDDVELAELRAVLDSDATFPEAIWAVKVKVTDQISSLSERRFNCMDQRLLPVWTGTEWSEPQATRNPAWAFCDAIKASYGGKAGDWQLDLYEIKRLADVWDARGDFFDYRFDTKNTLWRALQTICKVGRAEPVLSEEVFSIVRDEPKDVADYTFTMGSIEPGSFEMGYKTMDHYENDGVEIEYTDPETSKPAYVECVVPGNAGSNLLKLKLEGCTNHTQAYREGMFNAARLEYRNREAKFKTGLRGGLPMYGNALNIHYAYPEWAVSGQVLSVKEDPDNAGRQLIELSEPVTFKAGSTHKVVFTDRRGKPQGPFVVTETELPHVVGIDNQHNAEVYTGWNRQKTEFAFGTAEQLGRRFRMSDATHAGGEKFTITAEIDDDRVHQFDAMIDGGSLPVPAPNQVDRPQLKAVKGLWVDYAGTREAPVILLRWNAVRGAELYRVQISSDDGVIWEAFDSTRELYLRKAIAPGDYKLRVAAMAGEIGPWVTVDVSTSLTKPGTPTGLALSSSFIGNQASFSWDNSGDAQKWLVQVVHTVNEQEVVARAVEPESPSYIYTYQDARLDGVGRSFELRVWAVSLTGEYSATPAALAVSNPQVGALGAITVTPLQKVAQVVFTMPAAEDFDGFRVWAGSDPNFTASDATILVERTTDRVIGLPLDGQKYFRFAGMDKWGDDGLTPSAAYGAEPQKITETEIADDSIKTPHLAANQVTADKTFIGELSSITANLGDVTAGRYATSPLPADVRVELDSNSSYPLWMGSGTKNAANGHAFYDQVTEIFTLQDPTSGIRLEVQPGGANPIWLGAGSKVNDNSVLRVGSDGKLHLRGLTIWDDSGAVVLDSGVGLDLPNSLAELDSSAANKLGGIAAGADVTGNNTAAAIANQGSLAVLDEVSETYIANASVGTLKIQGQSVVIDGTYFSGSTVTLSETWGQSWSKVISFDNAESLSGVKVALQIDAIVGHNGEDVGPSYRSTLEVRVKRNGTVLRTWVTHKARGSTASLFSDEGQVALMITDFPGAGNHTYTAEARFTGGAYVYIAEIYSRYMSLSGAKR